MVTLRPFTENDFDRLIGWIDSEAHMVQWAGAVQFTYPLTRPQLEAYLLDAARTPPLRYVFTAVDAEGNPCGHIELGAVNRANETASLCRVLVAPGARGKGLSAPMVRNVLRMGFEGLHLRRIELRVFGFNSAAISSYLRAGFVREGLLRKSQKVGNEYWDTILMGMLREEWQQRDGVGDGP